MKMGQVCFFLNMKDNKLLCQVLDFILIIKLLLYFLNAQKKKKYIHLNFCVTVVKPSHTFIGSHSITIKHLP